MIGGEPEEPEATLAGVDGRSTGANASSVSGSSEEEMCSSKSSIPSSSRLFSRSSNGVSGLRGDIRSESLARLRVRRGVGVEGSRRDRLEPR